MLSTAASGCSFPSLQVTLAYVGACGGDLTSWRRRWADVAADLAATTGARSVLLPAELPPAPVGYLGRDPELARLAAYTDPSNRSRAASVVISGPVGVGKTALAVRFARSVAGDYPDGQLSVEMTASAVRGQSGHDVTGVLLRALGIPVPADPLRRAGLYRSVLARMRVLVLLDDAGSETAVRPLLAGGGRSLVLITSRSRLAGLDSVRRVMLDVLPPAVAEAVVVAEAGRGRWPPLAWRARSPDCAATCRSHCGSPRRAWPVTTAGYRRMSRRSYGGNPG